MSTERSQAMRVRCGSRLDGHPPCGLTAGHSGPCAHVSYCKCEFMLPDGTVVPGEPCDIHPARKEAQP